MDEKAFQKSTGQLKSFVIADVVIEAKFVLNFV
jgi:hypothetical protein